MIGMHMFGNPHAFTFKIGELYKKYGDSLFTLNILINYLLVHYFLDNFYS